MGLGLGRVKLDKENTSDYYEINSSGDTKERLWVVMVPHVLVGEAVKVAETALAVVEATTMDMFFATGDHVCVVYASLLTAAGPDVPGTRGAQSALATLIDEWATGQLLPIFHSRV